MVAALAGDARLLVIEGAAGAGKTTTLAAARTTLEQRGARLRVATPTLKAARVAAEQVGGSASSAAWLAHQHGYRWDEHGHWTRLSPGTVDPDTDRIYTGPSAAATLAPGDLLLVDEAGMLDQDTARALLTIADEHHTRLALAGDRHQLPAVGRGGVLDLAARWAGPDACLSLDTVHRFVRTETMTDGATRTILDEDYAQLSLTMRDGADPAAVFEALLARGQLRLHATEHDRLAALAATAADGIRGGSAVVVVADTREQVAQLNAAVRVRLVNAGAVADDRALVTDAGQRIGPGDRIVTRRNDTGLEVANRDTWTVTGMASDGALTVRGQAGERTLPAGYVRRHVELGYASTVHGVQGDTAAAAHAAIGTHSSAASTYVAMTRGRQANVAHLVADNPDDARDQWAAVFARDRADLGPAHAARLAEAEAGPYAPTRPVEQIVAELRTAWSAEQDALDRIHDLEPRAASLHALVALRREADTTLPALAQADHDARAAAIQTAARLQASEAVVARDAARLHDALLHDWDAHRPAAAAAGHTIGAEPARLGHRRAQRAARTDAHATLQRWAETWRPYLNHLPANPDALARIARQDDDRAALVEGFERWARHRAEQLHPDHRDVFIAAEQARAAAGQAHVVHRDASRRLNDQLWRSGSHRHTPDPDTRAAKLDDELTAARQRLDQARAEITALSQDPALLARPADRLSNEHARWQHDRADQAAERAAAAARVARTRAAAQCRELDATPRLEPHRPVPRQPDRGPGFDR